MTFIARKISTISFGLFCSIFSLCSLDSNSAELRFDGNTLPVLSEVPDRNTGLDKIYVIYDMKNVDLIFDTSAPQSTRIYKYSNLGGGYAEELTDLSKESDRVILTSPEGNMGYIVEEGDRRYYYWIVEYLPYKFEINSVASSPEVDCDATILIPQGNGEPIHYFTINGQQRTLDREIRVDYTTEEWRESERNFVNVASTKYLEYLTPQVRITPPAYCSTYFKISGDKFLEQWNWLSEAESDVISPSAVKVITLATQEGSELPDNPTGGGDNSDNPDENEGRNTDSDDSSGSNQINSNTDGLGGSAPADISFEAFTTEGVLHHEWQLTKDPNFEEIDYRFNQQSIDYIFTQEGTYYMRYIGSNFDGSCEAMGDTYTINIGASELKCPNAFTPDGDGVNDLWKVSYRSLLSFKCWIFDRYGKQMYYFDDPTDGWDGKQGGKTVAPGVYYYVIQAEGADGKKYKKSGDINILRHRTGSSSAASPDLTE